MNAPVQFEAKYVSLDPSSYLSSLLQCGAIWWRKKRTGRERRGRSPQASPVVRFPHRPWWWGKTRSTLKASLSVSFLYTEKKVLRKSGRRTTGGKVRELSAFLVLFEQSRVSLSFSPPPPPVTPPPGDDWPETRGGGGGGGG